MRDHLLAKDMSLGAQAVFAVLNVDGTVVTVREKSPDTRRLSFHHERFDDDPSHSGIYGYSEVDELIADLIAQSVLTTYQARK